MHNSRKIEHDTPKPFLRWAGGKRWLKKEIDKLVDINSFNNYHEPFIGGAAILFHLQPNFSFISDLNSELIQTYRAVKTNPRYIEDKIRSFQRDRESYYSIRGHRYHDPLDKASQFIYLNQLSYNGIYRVNSSGEYNVPYGNRTNFNFDFDNLYVASEHLAKTQIDNQDFAESLHHVREGDLVFLDPPYTIAHNENGFIQYNQKLFSLSDQYRLSDLINSIKERRAYYILTNAAHIRVREIFDKGDSIIEVERASVVGGTKASRGKYNELLFTNINR